MIKKKIRLDWRLDLKKNMMQRMGSPYVRFRKQNPFYAKKSQKATIRYGYFGSELKFKDTEVTSTAFPEIWGTRNPAVTDTLSGVAQGTSESEHLGRTMYMKSIHLKGRLIFPVVESAMGPTPTPDCRICVILDTDTKGVEVTASDVMDTGQTNQVLAFRNLQHTSRLKVLYDKRFIVKLKEMNEGGSDLYASPETLIRWSFHKRFKVPIRVLFSGTGENVSNVVDNSLHFICVSSDSFLRFEYQCRLRFCDTM